MQVRVNTVSPQLLIASAAIVVGLLVLFPTIDWLLRRRHEVRRFRDSQRRMDDVRRWNLRNFARRLRPGSRHLKITDQSDRA